MKPKSIIGLGIIGAAMLAVIAFAIIGNSSLELKVSDLLRQQKQGVNMDRSVKLTGIVVGDSIQYDPRSLKMEFDVVNTRDDLAFNLGKAERIRVVAKGSKPDTLQNEAEAIVTGRLAADGRFYAADNTDALLLKCPTKYVAEEPKK